MYENKKTEMHSVLKAQDPFNFSHCTGVDARTLHPTLHQKDFIYMLNLDFFLMSLELILMIIKKYVMADLCNWTKV